MKQYLSYQNNLISQQTRPGYFYLGFFIFTPYATKAIAPQIYVIVDMIILCRGFK